MNGDGASDPRVTLECNVAGVVGRAIQRLDALIGCRKEGPVQAPGHRPDTAIEIGVKTFPKRLGEILEIARTELRRRDEQNVVVIRVAERTGVPTQIVESRDL